MSTSVTRDFVSSGFRCESANKITAGQDELPSASVSDSKILLKNVSRSTECSSTSSSSSYHHYYCYYCCCCYWNTVCGPQFSADSSHPSMAEIRPNFDTIIAANLVIYDSGNDHQLPHIIKHFYRRLLLLKHTVKITF